MSSTYAAPLDLVERGLDELAESLPRTTTARAARPTSVIVTLDLRRSAAAPVSAPPPAPAAGSPLTAPPTACRPRIAGPTLGRKVEFLDLRFASAAVRTGPASRASLIAGQRVRAATGPRPGPAQPLATVWFQVAEPSLADGTLYPSSPPMTWLRFAVTTRGDGHPGPRVHHRRLQHPRRVVRGPPLKQPWASGGRTDLADGKLLCSFHHHRAHDPAWQTHHHANGATTFHRRT